jgi:hypothetical protein
VTALFFNGDELCAVVGDKAHVRRLNATPRK